MKLDSINWNILECLQQNSRQTNTEISKHVGITSPAVAERIRKMEDAGIIDGFGNKMFAFITNILFGGKLTDTLSSSRLFTRKAILEIKLNELSLCAVEQISARGMKRKQRFYEIIGNERARIGGERKMHRIPTGSALVSLIIKEFIFW